MTKILKWADLIFNILLALMYLFFIYLATSMFSFMPWYDENNAYLIYMLGLWLPLSSVTILDILANFIRGKRDKIIICLSALNAVYIPLIFLLGFIKNISLWPTQLIGAVGSVTMILYSVKYILYLKNNR